MFQAPNGRWPAGVALLTLVLLVASCVVVPVGDITRQSSMMGGGVCGEKLGAAYDKRIDVTAPDPTMVQEAVRVEINRVRCERGLVALETGRAAQDAALGHARAMAKYNFVGHRSPVSGHETFARRLRRADARFSNAGETVARTPLYAIQGRPYQVVSARRCELRQTGGGPRIPQVTYRLLAMRLVELWMNSDAHRDAVLDGTYRQIGAGIGIRTDTGRCGEVFASAVLLG